MINKIVKIWGFEGNFWKNRFNENIFTHEWVISVAMYKDSCKIPNKVTPIHPFTNMSYFQWVFGWLKLFYYRIYLKKAHQLNMFKVFLFSIKTCVSLYS